MGARFFAIARASGSRGRHGPNGTALLRGIDGASSTLGGTAFSVNLEFPAFHGGDAFLGAISREVDHHRRPAGSGLLDIAGIS